MQQQQDEYNYDYQQQPQPQEQQSYNYSYQYQQNNEYIQQQSNQYQQSHVYQQNHQSTKNLPYFMNKKQYQIIPYNSLYSELQKLIKQTQEMTALSEGWCLLLLRQFKWDVQLLVQYFQNMQKYQQKIGYKQQYNQENIKEFIKNIHKIKKNGQCQVCYGINVQLFPNICGHQFCIQCWKSIFIQNFSTNNPFVKCMTCHCPVLKQVINKYIQIIQQKTANTTKNLITSALYNTPSITLNKTHLHQKYQKILCQLFSSIHRNYQFCTGIDCNNCIKVYNLNLTTVRCTCNKCFCFKCKSDDHNPCTCDERKKWLETALKQEADAKWLSLNTKLCPWCKKAVERSAGCNFMACTCGKSFCYLCSRPWEPDHKDHFKCHIYKKSQNQQSNRQKQILQRMNFYIQRFLDNQKTAEQNKKFPIFQKRKYLFKTLKIDLSDSQFIDFSYKFSIQCCQTLKWINTFAYYKKWKDQLQKQKFQFYQGQFQKYKVNLLKLLAVDLKNFFKQVQFYQKQYKQFNQPIRQVLLQQFKSIKTNIVNYTTMTKKYKEKFLEEIQKMPEIQENLSKNKQIKKVQEEKKDKNILTRSQTKKQTNNNNNTMVGKITRYFKN